MENIVIEKNIPLNKSVTTGIEYYLDKMEVGDSFFLDNKNKIQSVMSEASLYGKITGKKFSTKKQAGRHIIWRIK